MKRLEKDNPLEVVIETQRSSDLKTDQRRFGYLLRQKSAEQEETTSYQAIMGYFNNIMSYPMAIN